MGFPPTHNHDVYTKRQPLLAIQLHAGVQMHLMHYLLVTIDPAGDAPDFISRLKSHKCAYISSTRVILSHSINHAALLRYKYTPKVSNHSELREAGAFKFNRIRSIVVVAADVNFEVIGEYFCHII